MGNFPENSLMLGATIVVVSAADREKNTRKDYLDLPNNLKFDASDLLIGTSDGELSCIFALVTGDNVEFNLRADHGLHEFVKDWLLNSTAPAFVLYLLLVFQCAFSINKQHVPRDYH